MVWFYSHEDEIVDSKLGDREQHTAVVFGIPDDEVDVSDEVDIDIQVHKINEAVVSLMSDDIDSNKAGIIELSMVLEEDARIRNGNYISTDIVLHLIQCPASWDHPHNRWEFQLNTASILGNLDDWGVSKMHGIPYLLKLLSGRYTEVAEEALKALTKIVSSGLVLTEAFRYELLFTQFVKLFGVGALFDKWAEDHQVTRSFAKLVLATSAHLFPMFSINPVGNKIFGALTQELFKSEDTEEVFPYACYALYNTTVREKIPIKESVLRKLVHLMSDERPDIAIPALELLGNITRWGCNDYNRIIIDEGALKWIEKFLLCKDKIVQNEACWMISNITASSKIEEKESIIRSMIIHLCYSLEDDDPDIQMNAAWGIFNYFIGLADLKEIKWPRRTIRDTEGNKLTFSTFKLFVSKEQSGEDGSSGTVLKQSSYAKASPLIGLPEMSNLGWGHCFTLRDLQLATNHFSDGNVIGKGRYGVVYHGTLVDGTEVAVKKLLNNLGQAEREFSVEVEAICHVRHKNLVRLRGYLAEGVHRMLVYEYMNNGNLEKWLHGAMREHGTFTWEARMKVLLGTAEALAYLHEAIEAKVIHGDIKSSNILIDHEFNSKVSDFGLDKLLDSGESHITIRVIGLSSEDPEDGLPNEKSDIYSFGILLLKAITGRDPVDYSRPVNEVNLLGRLRLMFEDERSEEALDPNLEIKPPTRALQCALRVALRCVDPDSQKRPKMSQVVRMLKEAR